MLKTRLIPVLLLKNGILVRSQNFSLHQLMGNHVEQVKRFSAWKADEIIYLDISRDDEYNFSNIQNVIGSTSSNSNVVKNSRNNIIDIISDISKVCRVPLSIGGKIKSLEDIKVRLAAGADKVVINSAAIQNPNFIKEASKQFGSQCIVVCVDVRKNYKTDEWEIYKKFGSDKSDYKLEKWLLQIQELGAGEILLQSIDNDGKGEGYDLGLIKKVAKLVEVPLIILGGAGKFEHFVEALDVNNSISLGAANIFHFTEQSIIKIKKFMLNKNINVRIY
tara:strand:+ start:267 stop:1097 length:831 start_codon:yes stop_codon:yes gene_type:complete